MIKPVKLDFDESFLRSAALKSSLKQPERPNSPLKKNHISANLSTILKELHLESIAGEGEGESALLMNHH